MRSSRSVHWDTVALLRDVVNYATLANVPVSILSLDHEKAFDRVNWGFLRFVLVHMGFDPSFVGWLDLFYSGVQSAVMVNGLFDSLFQIVSRGQSGIYPLTPFVCPICVGLAIFGRILGFGAWCCPGRRLPSLFCLSTQMIPLWSLLLPMPSR